jgi:protein-S-isoprenylcysteine O-methyltransferase Ste14
MQTFSLIVRSVFFTIIHPWLVDGLFPYLIIGRKNFQDQFHHFQLQQYIGLFIFIAGFIFMSICIIDFARIGKGTLSPFDPTRHLVTKGLYRFSRNPMYFGVLVTLLGESLFFRSISLFVYSLFFFITFSLFIFLYEEPHLSDVYGGEYDEYRKKVRRWI